jgi:hypothetical protein
MAEQMLSGDRVDLTNGLAALDKLSWFWKRISGSASLRLAPGDRRGIRYPENT